MADAECYSFSGGSIAGAVIGTFLVTVILGAILLLLWRQYNKRRAQNAPLRDLVLVEDGERGINDVAESKFSYDNPAFTDVANDPKRFSQPIYGGVHYQNGGRKVVNQDSSRGKAKPWLSYLFNKNAKHALDDSVLEAPQYYTATLKGHDFTGLGFNICGNMRDGIFIKDVMQRGPAAESKKILPGDRITSLTIAFDQIVLEDALTLLSYASPYDVTLEMLRLPEKSLSHKGINLSSPTHSMSHGSSSLATTEMVCHPFFKSHSIDDLRKVGKQHLNHKEDRRINNENGVKLQQSRTSSDSPTAVIVVPNNESRPFHSSLTAKLGFSGKTSFTKKDVANTEKQNLQKKPVSNNKSDETDSSKNLNVQQINVKPEVVPRAKYKSSNLKSESQHIVEAVSPVFKMAFEKDEGNLSTQSEVGRIGEPQQTPMIKPASQTVKIDCTDIPDRVIQHLTNVNTKVAESGAMAKSDFPPSVSPTEISITIEKEVTLNQPPVRKPERGQRKKDEVKVNEKTEEAYKSKLDDKIKGIKANEKIIDMSKSKTIIEYETTPLQEHVANITLKEFEDEQDEKKDPVNKEDHHELPEKENGKSKFSKFGIRVLPDINLSFGRKGSQENDGKNNSRSPKKEKTKRKEKSKEMNKKDDMKEADEEFKVSMMLPKLEIEQKTVEQVMSEEVKIVEEIPKQEDRPGSTDSTDSAGKIAKKPSSFHMPNLGIKLPMFGHSKQYSLEPDKDNKTQLHHGTPNLKGEASSNTCSPDVKMKKLDESVELEASLKDTELDLTLRTPVDPLKETQEKLSTEGRPAELSSPEPMTDENKEKEKPGFMSKGLQSLRDLKEKVTHKLSSSHDSLSSSSSSSEGEEKVHRTEISRKKHKKPKLKLDRDKKAEAKLKEKQEKEERAREKAKEKEYTKAKAIKKVELKNQASKPINGDHKCESSSAGQSENDETSTQQIINPKLKGTKSKEKITQTNNAASKSGSQEEIKHDLHMESIEVVQNENLQSKPSSVKSKLIPAKPPVAPRKQMEQLKRDIQENEKITKKTKQKKKVERMESSSSSSSSSSDSESGMEKKIHANEETPKRKAPSPPVEVNVGTLVVTKADVAQIPMEVHNYSLPEVVEATAKTKSKIPVKVSAGSDKRSASFADLSSLQAVPKSKSDSLERAVSMDMGTETTDSATHIPHGMVMSPVDDLSKHTDSVSVITRLMQPSLSSSESSSSETMKSPPNSVIHVYDTTKTKPFGNQPYGMKEVTQLSSDNFFASENDPSSPTPSTSTDISVSSVIHVAYGEQAETATRSHTEEKEIRRIATDAVDDVISELELCRLAEPRSEEHRLLSSSQPDIPSEDSSNNVTIMNVRNLNESHPKIFDIQPIDIIMEEQKVESARKMLRGDSKSRLMQTVADANEIKVSQKILVKKDTINTSSSSTSSQSSPEIRSDKNMFLGDANGATSPSPTADRQTIEISSTELDGIMMSHSEFLSKQSILYPIESPSPKQSSFDNWVYVDQKHSLSTSPSEPSLPEDDDSRGTPHSRNGERSPATYKKETEFETTELKVTTSAPIHVDSSAQDSQIYSTTMTLPQRSITQIILGPESGANEFEERIISRTCNSSSISPSTRESS